MSSLIQSVPAPEDVRRPAVHLHDLVEQLPSQAGSSLVELELVDELGVVDRRR
jgi:hypothetical protein